MSRVVCSPHRGVRFALPLSSQGSLLVHAERLAEAASEDSEGEHPSDADEGDAPEVRLVPIDVDEASGGIDGSLERLFQALSEGAALNPDEDESEEEDEAGFDMSGFYTAEYAFLVHEGNAGDLACSHPIALKTSRQIHQTKSLVSTSRSTFMENGQEAAISMDGATTEQLAMLARYDAMLEASNNADGRFDDPDEEK